MKLLLSGLYQLPLVQVPTYRGVKLELFEVGCLFPMWNAVVHHMEHVSGQMP